MFTRRLIALVTTAAALAAAAPAAEAKVVLRWEKLTVPVAEEATAQNSSAVVSLGKLGRVEVTQTREHVLLARTSH